MRSIVGVAVAALLFTHAASDGTAYNFWSMKGWGANLGNWLILERWMGGSVFDQHAPNAQDEWTFCQQASDPAAALADHWNSWITEADFEKLASVDVNMVRIPVGYWAFIQPDAGEPYVSQGQKAQIERVLGYCEKYNMYAIIDLHGLPGSQNGEAHSGHIGSIEFYSDYNINRGYQTVQAIVNWMNGLPSDLKARIAAIESANEPHVADSGVLNTLKSYYENAYNIISASPFKVPMMFHDGFQGLNAWSDVLPVPANAVIDLHLYYAFPPDSDTTDIVNKICASPTNFHLPVFVGEWSLASGVGASDWWYRRMMDTQCSVYQRGAGGTFWAIKNAINSDVWSFSQLIDEGYVNQWTFSKHTNAAC